MSAQIPLKAPLIKTWRLYKLNIIQTESIEFYVLFYMCDIRSVNVDYKSQQNPHRSNGKGVLSL